MEIGPGDSGNPKPPTAPHQPTQAPPPPPHGSAPPLPHAPPPSGTWPPPPAISLESALFTLQEGPWRIQMSIGVTATNGAVTVSFAGGGKLNVGSGRDQISVALLDREALTGASHPRLDGAVANIGEYSWGGGRVARSGIEIQDGEYIGAHYESNWKLSRTIGNWIWVATLSYSGFVGFRIPEQERQAWQRVYRPSPARVPVPAHAPSPSPSPTPSPSHPGVPLIPPIPRLERPTPIDSPPPIEGDAAAGEGLVALLWTWFVG